MDDERAASNGVAKNGKEIIIVDDLTPHIAAANNECNGHLVNGFHPSSASSSLDEDDVNDDDTFNGQNGATSSTREEFLTESSVDEECEDDVSAEEDDCAIVEEVNSVCRGGGKVAPSSRPREAEIRQEQMRPSPLPSSTAELPAPPSQTRSNQKVLPAATESVPNGQPSRRKQQRPNWSSSSSDSANKGKTAEANPSKAQGVVKAPDYLGVSRSRSQDRQRGAPPPSKLTRRANSGCNGLQSNGNGVRAVGVGANSRSQSVDHERVRVERIPGECVFRSWRLAQARAHLLRSWSSDATFYLKTLTS